MRAWLQATVAFVCLLCLWGLFELPGFFLPEPLRPTGDFFVLLLLYLLSFALGQRLGRLLRWPLGLCAAILVLYRFDRAAFVLFMGQEPLLYDQLFMLKLVLVLLSDLWTKQIGLALVAAPFALGLLLLLVHWLLRGARGLGRPPAREYALLLLLMLGIASLVGHFVPSVQAYAPRWATPGLLANLQRSREIYATVRRQVHSSPYRALQNVKLQRRPDIYLILVESYGRVIADRDDLREPWLEQLRAMEGSLGRAGWHTASAFSTAPVAGGRSWLAEGSVLTGIHIDYEAVFHHLVGEIDQVPNLVGVLAKWGYHTLLLAPADRVRKGVEEANYYNYERTIRMGDLGYNGPKLGWGVVPDQYSLSHTDENVLRKAPRPLFFDYHMVSSHTPWKDVPTLVDDWHSLSNPGGSPRKPRKTRDGQPHNSLSTRLKRYSEFEPIFSVDGVRSELAQPYLATILYDLKLLERFLPGVQGDPLVIIMGDHQPPLVASSGFETPVHLFARDPALLQEFKEHGFKDGLQLSSTDPVSVRHEGLFSLVIRALARCCSKQRPLPSYSPQGAGY